MGYNIAIGEALSRVEEDIQYNYVTEKIHDGAPWHYNGKGWATFSDNIMQFSNNGMNTLMMYVLPAVFDKAYPSGIGWMINVTEEVIETIQLKFNELTQNMLVRPCAYSWNENVHWAGVLQWMLWWCKYSIKKCIYPVIIFS